MRWRELLAGPASALVPEEARERLVRTVGVDPPLWSFLFGVIQLLAGTLLMVDDFMRVMPEIVAGHAGAYLDSVDPNAFGFDERRTLFWSGSFSWLTWVIRPKILLLASFSVWGLVRLTAFGVTREAVAEPLVWIGWQLWDRAVVRPGRAAERFARFGPDRPDRIERSEEGRLLVLSARPKPDWNDAVTIEHEDRFYRLKSVGELVGTPWWWYAHELEEEDPTAVIRRLVRYVPAAETASSFQLPASGSEDP